MEGVTGRAKRARSRDEPGRHFGRTSASSSTLASKSAFRTAMESLVGSTCTFKGCTTRRRNTRTNGADASAWVRKGGRRRTPAMESAEESGEKGVKVRMADGSDA